MKPELIISTTRALTGAAAAARVARLAERAVAQRGRFTVAFSGGSLIDMIAPGLLERSRNGEITWPAWHVFWADERCVPLTSPDSNYALAGERLFRHVPLPESRIYAMETERGPEAAADAYEAFLRRFFAPPPGDFPRFDLVLLGMGGDGHTASLFPGHPLLREALRWAAPVTDAPKPPPARVTMTLPVINSARAVMFVAAGAEKAGVLRDVLRAHAPEKDLPARRVRPTDGTLHWFIDETAAEHLRERQHERL